MAQYHLQRGKSINRLYLVLVSLIAVVRAEINFNMPTEEHLSTDYQNFVRSDDLPPMVYDDRAKPITHQLHFDFFESVLNALDWNYEKHGSDWEQYALCNDTAHKAQSPINITTVSGTGQSYRDWADNQFAFLPQYELTAIEQESKDGNYTHTIWLSTDDEEFVNGIFASEPMVTSSRVVHQVRWQADFIKFHYPAEHGYKGNHADMEVQIYHSVSNDSIQHLKDLDGNSASECTGGGVVSLFFNFTCPEMPNGNCTDPGKFFDFIDWPEESGEPQSIDLSELLQPTSALSNDISGYKGSDSVPPCDEKVCWYIYETHFAITPEQHQYFAVDGITSNAREMNLSPISRYSKILRNEGLFAN